MLHSQQHQQQNKSLNTVTRATGDIRNAIGKLRAILSKEPFKTKLPKEGMNISVLLNIIGDGSDPVPVLKLLSHCALRMDSQLTSVILSYSGHPLLSATDQKFVEEMFKITRNKYGLHFLLTPAQFLTRNNFSELRVLVAFDLLRFLQAEYMNTTSLEPLSRLEVEFSIRSVMAEGWSQQGDHSWLSLRRAVSNFLCRDEKELLPFKSLIVAAVNKEVSPSRPSSAPASKDDFQGDKTKMMLVPPPLPTTTSHPNLPQNPAPTSAQVRGTETESLLRLKIQDQLLVLSNSLSAQVNGVEERLTTKLSSLENRVGSLEHHVYRFDG